MFYLSQSGRILITSDFVVFLFFSLCRNGLQEKQLQSACRKLVCTLVMSFVSVHWSFSLHRYWVVQCLCLQRKCTQFSVFPGLSLFDAHCFVLWCPYRSPHPFQIPSKPSLEPPRSNQMTKQKLLLHILQTSCQSLKKTIWEKKFKLKSKYSKRIKPGDLKNWPHSYHGQINKESSAEVSYSKGKGFQLFFKLYKLVTLGIPYARLSSSPLSFPSFPCVVLYNQGQPNYQLVFFLFIFKPLLTVPDDHISSSDKRR